jgi:hypothetical protein
LAQLLAYAPRVRAEAGGVWADARGLPWAATAARLRAALGPEARAGVARVPAVAAVAARWGEAAVTVVPPGKEAAFLAPRPLAVLAPAPGLAAQLAAVGVTTCGALAALSADAVAVRFGAAGVALWRRARGEGPPLGWPTAPADVAASLRWGDRALRELEALRFVVQRLVTAVAERLRARGERAGALALTLELEGGGAVRWRLVAALPTARTEAWRRRVVEQLAERTLPDAVVGLEVPAPPRPPPAARPGDRPAPAPPPPPAAQRGGPRLVERWGPVLGRWEADAHPLPLRRRRWRPSPPAALGAERPPAPPAPALVPVLLPAPRPVTVRTRPRRDHAVPTAVRRGRRWWPVRVALGPDRRSGGHDDEPFALELWATLLSDGRLLWLARDARAGRWHLLGRWE